MSFYSVEIIKCLTIFQKVYGMRKFKAWDKEYPPTKWEIERNKRIAKKQGNLNGFIK